MLIFVKYPVSICHLAHMSPQLKQVLGAGVEPAYLSAPEPKSGVSAIPPPERPVLKTFYCSLPSGKRFAI